MSKITIFTTLTQTFYYSYLPFPLLMTFSAVQHERAPRPAVATAHHQLALQKLGYSFARQQTFFPTPTPLAFTGFPPLHAYNGFQPPPDALPNVHSSYLDSSSFQDFHSSRLPDSIQTDIPQLNPLLGSQVGSITSINPFKIPLFSSPIQYPVAHPGYFPSNIFYPSLVSTDSPTQPETQSANTSKCNVKLTNRNVTNAVQNYC